MTNLRKLAVASILLAGVTTSGVALAQNQGPQGSMMGSGMMGGWNCPMMMGSGMMQGGHMMMGPGMMMNRGNNPGQANLNLSVSDVKSDLEQWVSAMGNPHVKAGPVTEKDANTIIADVLTTDKGSLAQRFTVDRRTGTWKQE